MKTKKKIGLHQKWNTFFSRIQVKTKKNVFNKHGTLFSRVQVDTYPQMHTRVKSLRGMQDVDHTQTIGGDTVKLLGGIYSPHSIRVSAPLSIVVEFLQQKNNPLLHMNKRSKLYVSCS